MKKLMLGILMIVITVACFSQGKNVTIKGQGVLHSLNLSKSSPARRQILGTPYLNVDYMYGKIILSNGKVVKGLLRYNVRTQNFEIVMDSDTLSVSEPSVVRKVEFAGKTFIYSLALEEVNGKQYLSEGFYEVIAGEGEVSKLLVKHEKKIKESSYAPTYMGGGGTGTKRYVDEQQFYIKPRKGSAATRLDSKLDLIDLFSDSSIKSDEIREYISTNDINTQKIEDLKKFLNYCNDLRNL